MNSTDQIMEGVKQSVGLDLSALLAGFLGGKVAQSAPTAPATVEAEAEVAEPTDAE
jgi:hypothetical protein